MQAVRAAKAQEGKDKIKATEAAYKAEAKRLADVKQNTKAKVDDDLLDDLVDVDGDGVADESQAVRHSPPAPSIASVASVASRPSPRLPSPA